MLLNIMHSLSSVISHTNILEVNTEQRGEEKSLWSREGWVWNPGLSPLNFVTWGKLLVSFVSQLLINKMSIKVILAALGCGGVE